MVWWCLGKIDEEFRRILTRIGMEFPYLVGCWKEQLKPVLYLLYGGNMVVYICTATIGLP